MYGIDEFTDFREASNAFQIEGRSLALHLTKQAYHWNRGRRKIGVWGLLPEKFFKATPSRTSGNALFELGIKVAIIIDLCAQRKN